jgi:ATP-binding cassette, subfamily B, bacterial PglK
LILVSLIERLWSHIVPRRRLQLWALLLLMFLTSFAEIVSIGAVIPFLAALTAPESIFNHTLIQPVIQILHLTEPQQLLVPLTVIFAIAALISGAMRFLLLWAQTRLGHAIGADISISMYRRTLYQPYMVHLERNSSEVISGVSNKANAIVANALIPILTIISSILMLGMILFALVAIDPFVAIMVFSGFGAIYAVIMVVTKKHLSRYSHIVSREINQVVKVMQEGLGGIRDVLIDGSQETYCKVFRSADLRQQRARANIKIISGSPRFGIETLGMVVVAMVAYSLVGRSEGIVSTIPLLGVLALGAQRSLPVLQQVYSSWSSMTGGHASISDVLDLLDQPEPEYINTIQPQPMTFNYTITLNNLSFRYAPDAPWALRNLNLTISKGSRIGFIGTTGSGKSTLLDIIMGLLPTIQDELIVDDVALTTKNYRSWQTHIAHIPQAIFFSDATILENIAFGIPLGKIDHARVRRAAQQAQISTTIDSLEKKYDTVIGERGIRLSGGQRQRIGIARALYKQADVIIIDEATSALDNKTEGAVMKSINDIDNDITILIVAHRVTTLKGCDQIIELENGMIKRRGSYEEIISI